MLSGYRVIELSNEKGMLAAKLLADMGADVIRIERPGVTYSHYLNAGKRSITLDLEKAEGRDIFKRLVKKADVVVETMSPGYMGAIGLGYSELSKINPGLVMASITDFGQDGPYRDFKSSDLVAAALGGWLSVCGEKDAPLKPYGNQSYYTASLFAANGILLALWGRHSTGKGQYIDISIMECVAATLDHVLVRYFYEGVVARRQGSLYWNNAFRIFPCQDGYVLLSLYHQWETLVEWLESEGMAEDLTGVDWRDRKYRLQNLDHIINVLEKWTLSHTVAELVEKGQLMRFPWAEASTITGILQNPQLTAREFFTEIEIDGKKHKTPGVPCKMSHSPWRAGHRVSSAGEHNTDIYRREIGLSETEIEALVNDGVI